LLSQQREYEHYSSEETLSRSEEEIQPEEEYYLPEDQLFRSEEVAVESYLIWEEIASEVKPEEEHYLPEDQLSKSEEVLESADEVSSSAVRPEVCPSKIIVPPRPGSHEGYTLFDRYACTNPDFARKLRDSLTQTLTELVKSEITNRPGLFYKYYKYDPPDYLRISCVVSTPQDFDKCEGKSDLSCLLRFVKKTNEYCPKSIVDEFIQKRNDFCHGLHINTCVGRTVREMRLLFAQVKELLSCLKLDSGEVDKLEETFNYKVGISERARKLQNLTVEECKRILYWFIENMDNENVKEFTSGVIAPRISNIMYFLGRQ